MKTKVITIAVQVPEGEEDKTQLNAALKMLAPYQFAMSTEDDMTILELIEEDDEFDSLIAERARRKAEKLFRKMEKNGRHPWFSES
jgi:hypothetical protein